MHIIIMCIFHIDKFDFSAIEVNIQENYVKLTILPINSMLGNLFSKGIITFEEKQRIQALPVEMDRMQYFLDRIIIPSLKVNVDMKLRGFLKVMKESGDPTLISMAEKLGKHLITYVALYYCQWWIQGSRGNGYNTYVST